VSDGQGVRVRQGLQSYRAVASRVVKGDPGGGHRPSPGVVSPVATCPAPPFPGGADQGSRPPKGRPIPPGDRPGPGGAAGPCRAAGPFPGRWPPGEALALDQRGAGSQVTGALDTLPPKGPGRANRNVKESHHDSNLSPTALQPLAPSFTKTIQKGDNPNVLGDNPYPARIIYKA